MKSENFVVIHGWMSNHLNLFGAEREIYAIIYGFSQDGESKFTGTLKYLQEWTGAGRTSVVRYLKNLEGRGLITKHTSKVNGVTFNSYTCNVSYAQDGMGGTNLVRGGTNLVRGGGTNLVPNNIVIEKDKVKDSSSADKPHTTTDSTSSSSFEDRVFNLDDIPDNVIDIIEAACKRRGLKERDIRNFIISLEDNCNHLQVDRYGGIPGLAKLIDIHIANNMLNRKSCPG